MGGKPGLQLIADDSLSSFLLCFRINTFLERDRKLKICHRKDTAIAPGFLVSFTRKTSGWKELALDDVIDSIKGLK